MRTLSGLPEPDWDDLLMESRALPDSTDPGRLVAVVGGRIVGVMALDWRGKGSPPRPRRSGRPRYSWWLRRKVRFAQWVITERAGPGDMYVQFIAVVPEAQGMGVGTALLSEGEAMARKRGLERYTLYVAADNDGAKRLYERLGFAEQRRVRSRTTRRLFGVADWVYMVKPLGT
ncbi:MAG: GNAT family N-acetyltransferase [Thermoplasmata archaeon]|nr:MAG: GNAT family N-acetyltransferase [Thermoplasmata archaeon]